MNIKVERKSDQSKYKKLSEFIKNNEVYVGIPQDESSRKEEGEITNAELLFIHTYGSPVNNIPPRPVVEPAIKDSRERISKMMSQALKLVIDGNENGAIDQLKKVGMLAQNKCRAWFVSEKNGWPPNSPATRAAKIRKYKKSHGKNAEGYEPRPLIDTGELRKSITYFVKTRGGREK